MLKDLISQKCYFQTSKDFKTTNISKIDVNSKHPY